MGNILGGYKNTRNGLPKDPSAVTEILVMFYYTADFRLTFFDPIYHIRRQICYANQVLSDCEIRIKLYIYCIEQLGFEFFEDPEGDPFKRLRDYEDAKEDLLNTADIGILMCGTQASGCKGYASKGPTSLVNIPTKYPIAWVYPELDLIFLHEVSHIFGCEHDRNHFEEYNEMKDNTPSNYGYHMKGSNMLTIMARPIDNHRHIPRFLSKDKTYKARDVH